MKRSKFTEEQITYALRHSISLRVFTRTKADSTDTNQVNWSGG